MCGVEKANESQIATLPVSSRIFGRVGKLPEMNKPVVKFLMVCLLCLALITAAVLLIEYFFQ